MSKTIDVILRFGLAFAFLYPPVNAFSDPYSWLGYLPQFLRDLGPEMTVLHIFGLLEIIIAIWLITGKKIFVPSLFALIILVAITVLNTHDMQVIFRDISIAAIALALTIKHYPFKI